MMQLTQVKLAQMVSRAVNQTLTQHMQQTGYSPPRVTAANHVTQNAAAVQKVQPPIKETDIPVFKDDSAVL